MTGLLLDSHVFLWFLEGAPQLSPGVIRTLEETRHVFVSAVTVWELSIKAASGKLARQPFTALIEEEGFTMLGVSARHAEAIMDLPRYHRDPFDHLLLAQAKVENLTLVTHDRVLADYGVPVLLV